MVVACSKPDGDPEASATCAADPRYGEARQPLLCTRWRAQPDNPIPPRLLPSSSRYCRRAPPPAWARHLDDPHGHCWGGWSQGRAFDGGDASVLDHPWCLSWTNNQDICERGLGGVLACRPDTGGRPQSDAFFCQNWLVPDGCAAVSDGFRVTRKGEAEVRGEVFSPPDYLHFVKCVSVDRHADR